MSTILQVLTGPNINVDSSLVAPGANTTIHTDLIPEAWRPWRGFTYDTIIKVFRKELSKSYQGSPKPEPLQEDLRIFNEEVFDDLLRRFEMPIVNYALSGHDGMCHYGRGSRCGTEYKPDWSLVSANHLDQNRYFTNLVPGDTKLHAKWRPEMQQDGVDSHHIEWQKVVTQIVTYMACHRSRYGFVITDGNLVVFRLTRKSIPSGIAAARPRRTPAMHVRYPSDVSGASGNSSFADEDPLDWAYDDPEYVAIPWSAYGVGRLSVKLALWALAMMAANGDNSLGYWYPGLNTWRPAVKGYIHNTSGATTNKLGGKDKLEGHNPAGGEGASGGYGSTGNVQEEATPEGGLGDGNNDKYENR